MSPSPPPAATAVASPPPAENPPLPPGTPPPVEADEGAASTSAERLEANTTETESAEATEETGEGEAAAEEKEEASPAAAGVHKGKEGWTAVWDPSSNAYYFYNTITNLTTWENPLEGGDQANAEASTSAAAPLAEPEPTGPDFGGIDPDLAFLDPTLSRQMTSGAAPAFQARFNSRTGRFQGDPAMTPDRISDYQRGTRQQEVFYDTGAWTESLQGQGLKRSGESNDGASRKKKASAAEVAAFKAKKEMKKKQKLMDFLKS